VVKNIKIGVTGSNGFLGLNLVKQLKLKGYQVFEFTTSPKNKFQIELNYFDTKSIIESLSNIDVLIHAAWTSGSRINRNNKDLQNLNILISRNISEAARHCNLAKIIGIGSQDELGNSSKPWTDFEAFNPQSHYSEAKLATYNFFADATKNFVWARLFSAYGPGDPRDWILMNAIKALKFDQPLNVGKCNQLFNFTHIKDAANAIILLMEKDFNGTANISTLESPTLKDSLNLLEKISGKLGLIRYGEDSDNRNQIRSAGVLESMGWFPKINRETGFGELFNA
jgi:nucleoside-diphosphate-sugar epimerase